MNTTAQQAVDAGRISAGRDRLDHEENNMIDKSHTGCPVEAVLDVMGSDHETARDAHADSSEGQRHLSEQTAGLFTDLGRAIDQYRDVPSSTRIALQTHLDGITAILEELER